MTLYRHFCSTTYLLDKDNKRTLLHWHKKLQTWLPPGGHIEINETPLDAAEREIEEEYGLNSLEFIHPNIPRKLDNRSYALEMPHFLISEDIEENHIHLDWIFFAWVDETMIVKESYQSNGMKWFSKDELEKENNIFDNVKELALHGFENFYKEK